MPENVALSSQSQRPPEASLSLASPNQQLGEERLVLPILEERVTVQREVVETGRVRLTKTVTERAETIPLDLRHDKVEVEHVPINQFFAGGGACPRRALRR